MNDDLKFGYALIQMEIIDEAPGFFKKLRDFVGDFTIIHQSFEEQQRHQIKIGFKHKNIKNNGEMVDLLATTKEDKAWDFSEVRSY